MQLASGCEKYLQPMVTEHCTSVRIGKGFLIGLSCAGGKHPKRQSRLAAACRQVSSASSKIPGAGEGIRTLDPDLGKVVLYH
jgi:hypothetical protein